MLSTKEDEAAKQQWITELLECIEAAQSGHYFHSSSSTARMGRGSVLISRAKLQIPKSLKKELNKELAVIHMPQTLDKKQSKRKRVMSPLGRSARKHQRFGTQQQIDLLTLTTANDSRFTLSSESKQSGFSEDDSLDDDEKDFFESATPISPPSPLSMSVKLPAASSSSPRHKYKSRTPTASIKSDPGHKFSKFPAPGPPPSPFEEDEFVRKRSNSFGGSTSLKSASQYHKQPHHHVSAVVPQLRSIQDAKAKLRPKSAVKFKPLPLAQSNSSDAAPKQFVTVAAAATTGTSPFAVTLKPVEKRKLHTVTPLTTSAPKQKEEHKMQSVGGRALPEFPKVPEVASAPPSSAAEEPLFVRVGGADKSLLWRNADCKNMDNRLLFGKMRKRVRDAVQFADNGQLLAAMRQKMESGQRVMVVANSQDEATDHELVRTIRTEIDNVEQILVFNNARGVYRAPWVSGFSKVTLTQSEHALMSHIKTFADSMEPMMESAPSSPRLVSKRSSTKKRSTTLKNPDGAAQFKLNRDSAVIKKAATFTASGGGGGGAVNRSKGVSDALAVINRNKNKFKTADDAETNGTPAVKATNVTVSKTKMAPRAKPQKPFNGDPAVWNAYLVWCRYHDLLALVQCALSLSVFVCVQDAHGGSEPTNEWMLHKFVKAESSLPTISFKQAREMYKGCKGGGRI